MAWGVEIESEATKVEVFQAERITEGIRGIVLDHA